MCMMVGVGVNGAGEGSEWGWGLGGGMLWFGTVKGTLHINHINSDNNRDKKTT